MIYSHGLISVAMIPQTKFVAYGLMAFRANLVQTNPHFESTFLFSGCFSWSHCLPHDIGKQSRLLGTYL
jgi:hypothetical protein